MAKLTRSVVVALEEVVVVVPVRPGRLGFVTCEVDEVGSGGGRMLSEACCMQKDATADQSVGEGLLKRDIEMSSMTKQPRFYICNKTGHIAPACTHKKHSSPFTPNQTSWPSHLNMPYPPCSIT
ncbi:hypothetical protein VP01_289g1 [Puccinia sorghi]|uniref:Uncharacterized protein n=1 Tax=Puccinia sorghi TaxID=27349 RepID=A0A0L6V1J3_9BASI|nr:hypothetical protein VP01_289g1 [Puccinia sorghi]